MSGNALSSYLFFKVLLALWIAYSQHLFDLNSIKSGHLHIQCMHALFRCDSGWKI